MAKIQGARRASQVGKKKSSYKSNRKKRAKSSYQTYLDNRAEWERKGYALDPALTREQFKEQFQDAKDAGLQNIAREFAKADRYFTRLQAQRLHKQLPQYSVEDILSQDVSYYDSTLGRNVSAREFYYFEWINLGGTRDEFESAIY